MLQRLYKKAIRRKSIASFAEQISMRRHLTLFDLICIGVASTCGSGVFVLIGLVANQFAGPGVIFSWLVAGFTSYCSATAFAELCCIIPSSGSIYAYGYVALGEWLGYIAASCLTLECCISASAISRAWGVKFETYVGGGFAGEDSGVNWYAGLLQTVVVVIFLCGIEASKITINVFTVARMFLFGFMLAVGLYLFQARNVQPMAPMGVSAILKGASPLFFGIVGFEEITCMHTEALNPNDTLPTAMFATIAIVTAIYCLCSLALVGCVPYTDIDQHSGFASAFEQRGMAVAAHVTIVGELLSLPLVAMVSFLPQPRIFMAMAQDKLIPDIFKRLDNRGNLVCGILISGAVSIAIALFVPFVYLDELISGGILVAFSLTNACVILIRSGCGSDEHLLVDHESSGLSSASAATRCRPEKLFKLPLTTLLVVFVAVSAVQALLMRCIEGQSKHRNSEIYIALLGGIFACVLVLVFVALYIYNRYIPWATVALRATTTTPRSGRRSGKAADALSLAGLSGVKDHYTVPLMPFTPLFGLFVNTYLLCQLSAEALLSIVLYFVGATVCYVAYGAYRRARRVKRYRDVDGALQGTNREAVLGVAALRDTTLAAERGSSDSSSSDEFEDAVEKSNEGGESEGLVNPQQQQPRFGSLSQAAGQKRGTYGSL